MLFKDELWEWKGCPVGGKNQATAHDGSVFITVVFVVANSVRIQRSFEVYPLELQLCWCTDGKKKYLKDEMHQFFHFKKERQPR